MIYHFQNALQLIKKEVRFDPARGYFWSYDAPVLEGGLWPRSAILFSLSLSFFIWLCVLTRNSGCADEEGDHRAGED